MEGFLADLGKSFAEKWINGAIEKSRYVFCFKCIAKEFEDEKVKLEPERATMRQRFRVAIEKDKEIQFNAKFWEDQANKLIQEDTTKPKQKCFFGFCPDCIWRYKRGEDLATKIKEIKNLIEKGEKLENVEIPRHLPGVERYSSKNYIPFESRELKFKELLDALRDDSNFITGLHGMGGTGKTTLAKEVGKQLKTLEQFDHVIDTTVSSTPNIKKIQDDIAGSLGLKLRDVNESDRPKKLWSRLTNGEKILVILDDVWGNLKFNDIGIPNFDNHVGCKVLVTTRNLRVCNKMVCGKTIQLELLSEEDAWIMFKMYADLTNNSSKTFLDKGRKIAIKCKRLPVAIATMASSLKGQKRREEWDVAIASLQKSVSMVDVDDDLVDIYKCLKVSYDYLKDEKAKRVFLLCSVFQEDEEISVEILTRLGIGVGLFGEDYGSYEDARSKAVVAKNKLLDSCLLLETEKGEVKMHDLVREVAQWIANKEIQEVNLYGKNRTSLVERDKNMKYLSCEGNLMDIFSSRFDGSKLEILIVKMDMGNSMNFPISFFENIVWLRVLNLKYNVDCFGIEKPTLSLPQSIQSLANIRSLLVESVNLGDISVLGSLQSLETLDLTRCEIDELPRDIAKLEKLRLLNLELCVIRSNNPFEVIQICPSLEEFYFFCSFNNFCQEITLPAFERYHVIDSFCIMKDSLSKIVSLQGHNISEATFNYLMQTAEFLQLERIKKGWKNIMPEYVPIDQGMNDLVELHLLCISQLQCLIDSRHTDSQVPNVLSKLVVLRLYMMENLEELCKGPISFGSLNKLEVIIIRSCLQLTSLFKCNLNLCNLKTIELIYCPALVSIFELSTSQSLLLLEKLEITDCRQLENIFTNERIVDEMNEEILVDGDNNNNKSCNSIFPKLKVLNIQLCPQLQVILPLHSAKDLLLLEAIKIKRCENLKYIFGQHQDVELASLKELELHDLPNFIDIFPEPSSIKGSSNSISKPQTQLDPIKSNIFSWSRICCYRYKLRGNTSTKITLVSEDQQKDCSISMVSNSKCLHLWERAQCLSRSISHIVCNIKVIELVNISNIKSVFMLSIAPKMLLESLTIKNCDELEHIIVDIGDDSGGNEWCQVFPNLKEIYIENCKKLEYIFGRIDASDDHQNQIEVIHLHFPALECLKLYSIPTLTGMCTKNYHTVLPRLTDVKVFDCFKVDIRSIGDFYVPYSKISISQEIGKTIKELSGHYLTLKGLMVNNNSNEANEQQMNLSLECIDLHVLPIMTYLFVGPKNSFSLPNLTRLKIRGCGNLKILFSTSIIMCLPQLFYIRIEECKELKHIIEVDLEDKRLSCILSSRTCFPKLESLVVVKCNMLKYVFPVSISKELPQLKTMMIRDSDELEEIFKSEGSDQKVEIPNLKVVAFVNLPLLSYAQGVQFLAVKNRFVQNCQKLSLTSAKTAGLQNYISNLKFGYDYKWHCDLVNLFKGLQEDVDLGNYQQPTQTNNQVSLRDDNVMEVRSNTERLFPKDDEIIVSRSRLSSIASQFPSKLSMEFKCHDNGNENPSVETPKDLEVGMNVQAASGHDMTTLQGIDTIVEEGTTSTSAKTKTSSTRLELDGADGQVSMMTSFSIVSTYTNDQVCRNDDVFKKVSSNIEEQFAKGDEIKVSKSKPSPSTIAPIDTEIRVQEALGHELILSQELMDEESMDQQCLMNSQHSPGEIDTTIKPSQGNKLEGSTSEKIEATTLPTILGTMNEPPIQLVASKQKEVGDSKICIPSFSIVNTKPTPTKDVDIGDSRKTIAMEDINKLIEEDPLLAFEKLLTGQVSISFIRILLQELKSLMDSSSDLEHLISNQELKSKLISLFNQLKQHQGLLPSHMKEFIEKVQTLNDYIIKYATFQQVLKKHNQLLHSKTDLVNKLWSAYSTQTRIDHEISTANARIDELSLQTDEHRKELEDIKNQREALKSVLNRCDVQKNKLKAECTEWAQQSDELISAFASSEADVREAERARNLATEAFANLKSSFPAF